MDVHPEFSIGPNGNEALEQLESIAKPLLDSPAFQRLRALTFLGILSPRFALQIPSPLWSYDRVMPFDGTRMDHSVGVAIAALMLARQLRLSSAVVRYAIAWGLTHDIATWPLSHTGETAFRSITRSSSHDVREAMLVGSEKIPPRYRLDRFLRSMDVEPTNLLSLFQRSSNAPNAELEVLRQVIQSPLTPDTLEGTWRSGKAFGVPVPSPAHILPYLVRVNGRVCLRQIDKAIEFWRRKAEVYDGFINRPDIVLWESAWTLAIKRECGDWALEQTLDASEEDLVARISAVGLPKSPHVVRYKKPQEYVVSGRVHLLGGEPPVGDLWSVLERKPREVPAYE